MELSEKNKEDFGKIFTLIDLKLSASNIAISLRPFLAVSEFVEDFIIEIKGDTKDNYHKEKWFKHLYNYSVDWYKDRYGSAFDSKPKNYFKGVILIYQTPFEIRIPQTIVKKDDDGISKWITFPNDILPEENVNDWLVTAPNYDKTEENIGDILNQIKNIGSLIRSISVGLMTATSDNDVISGMKAGIITHLEAAAEDILRYEISGISLAFWEMQLALEKILKVYLMQRGEQNPYNHNILNMVKVSKDKYKMKIDSNLFGNIPSDKEAIKYRYGEIRGTTQQYAYEVYKNILLIISLYSQALKRKLTMNNASFKIAPPPWMGED